MGVLKHIDLREEFLFLMAWWELNWARLPIGRIGSYTCIFRKTLSSDAHVTTNHQWLYLRRCYDEDLIPATTAPFNHRFEKRVAVTMSHALLMWARVRVCIHVCDFELFPTVKFFAIQWLPASFNVTLSKLIDVFSQPSYQIWCQIYGLCKALSESSQSHFSVWHAPWKKSVCPHPLTRHKHPSVPPHLEASLMALGPLLAYMEV